MSERQGYHRIPRENPGSAIDTTVPNAVPSQNNAAASVSSGMVPAIGHGKPPKQSTSKSQKKHRRKLTAKQRALIRALTKTKHQGKAAVAAGYSPKHARQSAYQALESIRKTAPELLARHGLDDDSLIDKHLLPLMNAEETKFFTLPVGKGKDRRLRIESRKTANWSARQNGLDMAFKIRGLYVREQENKGPEFSVVVINGAHRPDWDAMRRAHPKIEVPGLNPPTKKE